MRPLAGGWMWDVGSQELCAIGSDAALGQGEDRITLTDFHAEEAKPSALPCVQAVSGSLWDVLWQALSSPLLSLMGPSRAGAPRCC